MFYQIQVPSLTMNYKEAYERFYPDLLKSLPMADPQFHESLEKRKLFSGDLLEEVKAKDTEARKAAHFLQNAINHSLKIDNTEPFDNLLEVMESSDNGDCKSLAKEIKTYLSKEQSLDSQTVVTIQPHPNATGEHYLIGCHKYVLLTSSCQAHAGAHLSRKSMSVCLCVCVCVCVCVRVLA